MYDLYSEVAYFLRLFGTNLVVSRIIAAAGRGGDAFEAWVPSRLAADNAQKGSSGTERRLAQRCDLRNDGGEGASLKRFVAPPSVSWR